MIFDDLGLISFSDALAVQADSMVRIAANKQQETVYLLEHPSVFTMGRGGQLENVLTRNDWEGNHIELVRTNFAKVEPIAEQDDSTRIQVLERPTNPPQCRNGLLHSARVFHFPAKFLGDFEPFVSDVIDDASKLRAASHPTDHQLKFETIVIP